MNHFNAAYSKVLAPGRLTVGLLTPLNRTENQAASVDQALEHAALADELGFAALWTRDVPLMIPQGSDKAISIQDDPFLWLGAIASATRKIALGTAAIVLPLRHPLHIAKASLTLDRLSQGRFILGLGSGDRPEEFASFGESLESRRDSFRQRWPLIRSALSPETAEREPLLAATGGYDLMTPPGARIPMVVVGSARQSLQWIAQHADAWATYHRPESQQGGRINLWRQALQQRSEGFTKPFIQSVQLELLESPSAAPEPLELGLRTGRHGLVDYLQRMQAIGVQHVILSLATNSRPIPDLLREIGEEVLPKI